MKKTEDKRLILKEKIADHLLEYGLQKSSLRQIAAAVGTSDRMLLHYFADKEDLLTSSLFLVTERLVTILNNAGTQQMPFKELISYLANIIKDPVIRPFTRLWLELVVSSMGEDDALRGIAREICDLFCAWIASVLEVDREENKVPMISLAFSTLEGFVLMDTLNYDTIINNALVGIRISQASYAKN